MSFGSKKDIGTSLLKSITRKKRLIYLKFIIICKRSDVNRFTNKLLEEMEKQGRISRIIFFYEKTDMYFYLNEYTNMYCGLLKAYAGLNNMCVNAGKDRVGKLRSDLIENLLTITS